MINDITIALSQRLEECFDNIEIYIDRVPQGIEEPCFFILTLQNSQKQIVGDRYYRAHGFDLHYFPSTQEQYAREINDIADQLWMALEYIDLENGPIRGTGMRCEKNDGVLHFFVNYDVFIFKKRERGPLMKVLKQSQRVKT